MNDCWFRTCCFTVAYLLPYVIFLLTISIPLILYHISIGQLSNKDWNFWMFSPFFTMIHQIAFWITLYGTLVSVFSTTWPFIYIILSFKSPLPWKHCKRDWYAMCKLLNHFVWCYFIFVTLSYLGLRLCVYSVCCTSAFRSAFSQWQILA